MIYLILGSGGSGRREVLADLIEGGLGETDRAAVMLTASEREDPVNERLPNVTRFTMVAESQVEAEMPAEATHIFIVFDGRLNPVDQIEGFKSWLGDRGAEIARVLCVVNCHLLEQNPKLFAWYEACIHFSDVVLLNGREGVPNKWVADFRGKFEQKFYPCLFEFVKEGGVKNPALVLAPVARRMSHVFDEVEWIAEDDEDDEDEQEEGEEVEMKAAEDPYLERRNGGRRVHEIPNIADYLPKAGQ